MSLRQELSLLFGGLIVLVLSLVVGVSYSGLRTTLEGGIKEQLSPQLFLQVLDADSKLLAERARVNEAHVASRNFLRKLMGELAKDTSAEERPMRLAKARSGHPEEEALSGLLWSAYDRTVESFKDVDPPHDLVAVFGDEGGTLTELLGGVTSDDFAADDFSIAVVLSNLKKHPLWKWSLEYGHIRGCLVYPDGKLYLYGVNPLFKGQRERRVFEGLNLVGTEIDREYLKQRTGGALAFVSYEDTVIGINDEVERWGKVLVNSVTGPTPEIWTSPDGKTFVIKSAPLLSSFDPPQEGGQVGVEVGRVYFIRDYAEVEAAANQQASRSLLLGLAALLAALLAVPLVARRFTGPIGALSSAMKSVGDGGLEQIPESQISSITEVKEASLSFNEMVIGLRQKKALEAFVPEGTRQEVEQSGGEMPELGGQRLERTIMFSDLRGFTAMSERLPAGQVMEIINKYLHAMSAEIRKEGGDINEYIGDAILAVFADPDASVRAARKMNTALKALHDQATTEELKGLSQGIGLHTGFIVEGNIGEAGTRLKRAVVGDTVNLAARIQDRSRDGAHTCIFLSGDTKDKLSEEFDLEFFGDEDFKGKAEPVPVWEVRS